MLFGLMFNQFDFCAALQMSVQDAGGSSQSDMSKVFEDRSFVTSILNSVSICLEPMTC